MSEFINIEFTKFRKKAYAELRALTPDEISTGILDPKISISLADKENGSPKYGDMIARNPNNHEDQWLVSKEYFEENFEEIK